MSGDDHRLLVTEEELVALFEPHRADAAQFRARIAAKVAERRGAPPAASGGSEGSSFLRRAASLLPPEFGVAATASKLASAKGLTFALALPFLVLASSVVTLFAGVRSMRRSARDAAPPALDRPRRSDQFERAMAGRWFSGASAGVLIVAAIAAVALGGRWALDAVLVCIVVSMSAMTAVLHRMSRAGVLTRDRVANLVVAVLVPLTCGGFFFARSSIPADRCPMQPFAVAGLVLLVGMLVALAVASERTGWRRVVESVVLVLGGAFAAPSISTSSSPLALSASFERFDEGPFGFAGWEARADFIEALRATGSALPDMSCVEARIDAALSNGGAPDWVWTSAARMGLMTPERWMAVARDNSESERIRHLFADGGDLHPYSSLHILPMALAAHPPSVEEREALVERVRASWPRPDDERALDGAANFTRWFHGLGRDDEVAARAADIHRILMRHWVTRPSFAHGRGGGFTLDTRANAPSGDATLRAIELIAAVGAPPEIELERVHGFLQGDALDRALLWDFDEESHAPARAALLRLEREIGLPPRSWFERLLDQRAWIVASLLVLLCFFAIASAPAAPSGGGAQPRKRRA